MHMPKKFAGLRIPRTIRKGVNKPHPFAVRLATVAGAALTPILVRGAMKLGTRLRGHHEATKTSAQPG